MSKFVAWAITGAGHLLKETFLSMKRLVDEYDAKVTTFLSLAAIETVRIYGLSDMLRKVSDGSYYSEVLTGKDESAAAPHAGRFSKRAYDVLIVSPATANTVAKIVSGIADTLVTNTVAHACKGSVPVLIIPTDQEEETETTLPPMVDREACRACEVCPPIDECPHKAVERVQGKARIDLSKCYGAGICAKVCPYGVVKIGERVKVKARKVDLENVRKLREMDRIEVLRNPNEIVPKLVTEFWVRPRGSR
nr:dihydromethanopterin reductase (acceptor) [Candidatus Njordarchaeum guaymaensis]